jgi:hypothetical protein
LYCTYTVVGDSAVATTLLGGFTFVAVVTSERILPTGSSVTTYDENVRIVLKLASFTAASASPETFWGNKLRPNFPNVTSVEPSDAR